MINYNGQVEKPSLIFTRDDELISMLPSENKAELLKRANLTDKQVEEIATRMRLIAKHAVLIMAYKNIIN